MWRFGAPVPVGYLSDPLIWVSRMLLVCGRRHPKQNGHLAWKKPWAVCGAHAKHVDQRENGVACQSSPRVEGLNHENAELGMQVSVELLPAHPSSISKRQPAHPIYQPVPRAKMLLSKLLLLPVAVASSVTLYVSSVPVTSDVSIIPSPIPLAQIDYDADQSTGTLISYTPPTGSYTPDHLLRIGLTDPKSGSWRGIVTSAASFADQYHKKITVHVDEKGEPFHVGFGTSAKGAGEEVEVEIVKRAPGPKPVLNKPIVLNAEGKLESKEPEKSFLQK